MGTAAAVCRRGPRLVSIAALRGRSHEACREAWLDTGRIPHRSTHRHGTNISTSEARRRRRRHPPLPRPFSGRGARRHETAHRGDTVARAGDRHGSVARRAARDGSEAGALLGRPSTTGASARRSSTLCRNSSPRSMASTFISFTCVRNIANALPMIVTHGWPGSIIEQLKIIDPLTNPTAHGGSASDAFDVVIPSLPGYGFSGKPTRARLGSHSHRTGMDRVDEAPRIHTIRGAGRRLGECGHGTDGSAGGSGVDRDPHQHACHGARPTSTRRLLPARRRHQASQPTKNTRMNSSRSSTSTAWATPRRWRTARRRSTGSGIRRSAWPPGCSTTTRAAWRSSRGSLTVRVRGSRETTFSTTSRSTG